MHRRQLHRTQEVGQVADDGAHRVVVVLRVVGFALAELVGRDHAIGLRQRWKILAPRVGTRRRVTGAEVAAIDEYYGVAAAPFEVPRANSIRIDPASVLHNMALLRKVRGSLESNGSRA